MRRRVFGIVLVLTGVFLGPLRARDRDGVPTRLGSRRRPTTSTSPVFAGAMLLGLAMFATFFLGTVIAVFLTLGGVRGDAERGLLQPLVVRPPGA